MNPPSSSITQLRAEIAAAAARMIAENGCDYGTAKKKAARLVLGNARTRGEFMPDNSQIEDEVRNYNEMFFSETQPARLLHLRRLALGLMDELVQFAPHLTGAVLSGTAGEHSDIHLQLFVDSAKDVEIFLINRNIDFEVSEARSGAQHVAPFETLSFIWHGEGVHLVLNDVGAVRSPKTAAGGRLLRADASTVRAMLLQAEAK
jgi:hypothetical protein